MIVCSWLWTERPFALAAGALIVLTAFFLTELTAAGCERESCLIGAMRRLSARKNLTSAALSLTKLRSSRGFGKEWRDWDLLQRSSFFAQCATAAALVVTVVFHWATWREANQLRLDTAALYFA